MIIFMNNGPYVLIHGSGYVQKFGPLNIWAELGFNDKKNPKPVPSRIDSLRRYKKREYSINKP